RISSVSCARPSIPIILALVGTPAVFPAGDSGAPSRKSNCRTAAGDVLMAAQTFHRRPAKDRPGPFALQLTPRPVDYEAAAMELTLQAPPPPWRRGRRLRPSRTAKRGRTLP